MNINISLSMVLLFLLSSCRSPWPDSATYTEEYQDLVQANGTAISMRLGFTQNHSEYKASTNTLMSAQKDVAQTASIVEFYRAILDMEYGEFDQAFKRTSTTVELWPENIEFTMLHMLCCKKHLGEESIKEAVSSLHKKSPLPAYIDVMTQTLDSKYEGKYSKDELTFRQRSFINKLEQLNKIEPSTATHR